MDNFGDWPSHEWQTSVLHRRYRSDERETEPQGAKQYRSELGQRASKQRVTDHRSARSRSRSRNRGSRSAQNRKRARSRSRVRYRPNRSRSPPSSPPSYHPSRSSKKSRLSCSPARQRLISSISSSTSKDSHDSLKLQRALPSTSVGSGDTSLNFPESTDKALLTQLVQAVQLVGRDSFNKKHFFHNVIPEFDPSHREQTITTWLNKVNECAIINNLNEQQIIQMVLPKFKGLAQKWYESLPTVLYSWQVWQEKLKLAFSSEENCENYGQLLTTMLEKRSGCYDSLEEYFHEKLMLLNRCGIEGKRAVDCIVLGIDDPGVRLGAEAVRFDSPESLLRYLKNVKRVSLNVDCERKALKCERCSGSGHASTECTVVMADSENVTGGEKITKGKPCFNCRMIGHNYNNCPNPMIKCGKCFFVGHRSENCTRKIGNPVDVSGKEQHKKKKNVNCFISGEGQHEPDKREKTKMMPCFNCRIIGHNSRDCPKPLLKCDRCSHLGHTIENCTKPEGTKCKNCRQKGHELFGCPKPLIDCRRCGHYGHMTANCKTNLEKLLAREHRKKCFNCHQEGHEVHSCPLPVIQCDRCSSYGHTSENCALVQNNPNDVMAGGVQSNNCNPTPIMCHNCHQELSNCHKAGRCPQSKQKKSSIHKCSNCQQEGHFTTSCPEPLIKCNRCSGFGHPTEKCSVIFTPNLENETTPSGTEIKPEECGSSKQCKKALINGKSIDCIIDFNSIETMISVSTAKKNSLGWQRNNSLPVLKGFGDAMVKPIGTMICKMVIDRGSAEVKLFVVPDEVMPHSLMVGQSFTEQSIFVP